MLATKEYAIIFDMDGVIIDSVGLYIDVEKKFFQAHGQEYNDEMFIPMMGLNMEKSSQIIKEKLNLDWDLPKITMVREKLVRQRLPEISLFAGYTELMQNIIKRGYPRALASASSADHINLIVNNFKLREHFGAIVSADDVANSKPAPDIFLEAAKRLRVKPQKCIVLEDSIIGVTAAKAAGMKCVAVPSPYLKNWPNAPQADLHNKHLKDITVADLEKLFL